MSNVNPPCRVALLVPLSLLLVTRPARRVVYTRVYMSLRGLGITLSATQRAGDKNRRRLMTRPYATAPVVKVRGPGGLSPLLPFEPPAIV